MSDEQDADVVALMDGLRREMPVPANEADRILRALRAEAFPDRPRRRYHVALQAAAAIALLCVGGVGGAVAGAHWQYKGSLEAQLARKDLTLNQRLFLMQRAGSAYVEAAHGYAGAAAHTDSTAVEVASKVLIGAARAVAQSDLDGDLSPKLTAVLASARKPVQPHSPLIWF